MCVTKNAQLLKGTGGDKKNFLKRTIEEKHHRRVASSTKVVQHGKHLFTPYAKLCAKKRTCDDDHYPPTHLVG